MRVAICVSTLNRPKLLAGLLQGIEALTFQQMQEPTIVVSVADNDILGSAQEVSATMTRWELRYSIEPRRGLAEARNCALQNAGKADFFTFIDDDEIPDPNWLEQLLLTQATYAADVVSGLVVPVFAAGVPAWISNGGFFDSPAWPTGHLRDSAATNNVLVAAHVFERVHTFDERFKLGGGEDFHFFRRAYLAGFKICWSQGAIVREVISEDRANVAWLLRRAFRNGNCAVLVELSLDQRIATRLRWLLRASGSMLLGGLMTLPFLVSGRRLSMRALRRAYMGAGMLAGVRGWSSQVYRTTTGE